MIGKALKRQVTEVRESVLCQGLTTGYAPELSMLSPEFAADRAGGAGEGGGKVGHNEARRSKFDKVVMSTTLTRCKLAPFHQVDKLDQLQQIALLCWLVAGMQALWKYQRQPVPSHLRCLVFADPRLKCEQMFPLDTCSLGQYLPPAILAG